MFSDDESQDQNQNRSFVEDLKELSIPKDVIKRYLVTGKNAYLLNNENYGNVISLNGHWGSGKTYFWKNELEPILSDKLVKNDKAVVYSSLYGKDSIEDIKDEIYIKAYENLSNTNKKISKTFHAFSKISGKLSSTISLGSIKSNTNESFSLVREYILSGEKNLKNGGIICLDDFERKSSKIDLYDLFGFITNLATDLNAIVVIILNSFSFDDEETEVFSKVKEKSIHKHLIYQPSVDELYHDIYSSSDRFFKLQKYHQLILDALKETKELNARIYKQVIENCLEWVENKEADEVSIRTLVLATTNFSTNNIILDYTIHNEAQTYRILKRFFYFKDFFVANEEYLQDNYMNKYEFANYIMTKGKVEDSTSLSLLMPLYAVYFYGYYLQYDRDLNHNTLNEINDFVKTGILFEKVS